LLLFVAEFNKVIDPFRSLPWIFKSYTKHRILYIYSSPIEVIFMICLIESMLDRASHFAFLHFFFVLLFCTFTFFFICTYTHTRSLLCSPLCCNIHGDSYSRHHSAPLQHHSYPLSLAQHSTLYIFMHVIIHLCSPCCMLVYLTCTQVHCSTTCYSPTCVRFHL
jgi:hypothetical protein